MPDVTELLGYAASGLVLAAFSVRSLTLLRSVAIASNLLFIAYAALADLPPVLILHGLLLPLNGMRLHQAMVQQAKDRLPCRLRAARRQTLQRPLSKARARRRFAQCRRPTVAEAA